MKITANEIRQGNILEIDNKLYVVSKMPIHTKPGKGGAFVQVEMKELRTGVKINERFNSTIYIEKVRLDQIEHQFLYVENDKVTFMNTETYEQIELDKDLLNGKLDYLTDSAIVQINFHNDVALDVIIAESVVLKVVEADAVIKGQTATSSYKPAILENGIRIMVPPFVEAGDIVVVRTEDGTYLERAKN